jgi:hypothetical protein
MKTAAVSVRGVDIGLSGVLAEQGEDDLSAVRRPSWIEGSAIDAQSDPSETFSGGAHNKEPSTTGEQDLSAVRRPATGFLGQAPRRYAPHVVVAQLTTNSAWFAPSGRLGLMRRKTICLLSGE